MKDLRLKVEKALDTIRPYLETDGGNIEVVEITSENELLVRLLGNCETCPMSYMTMKAGVEEAVKKAVPQIIGIRTVNLKSTADTGSL